MTLQDILAIRLANEQLTSSKFKTPEALVKWFGAVQSQDYSGAKWALGQRLGLNDLQLEQAFNEVKILRTHVMRPTWHFVHPDDLVWMQKLTSPRVKRIMNYYNKILGLDAQIFEKTNKIIADVLKGENYLTRLEIKNILEKKGVFASTQKLGHIVSWAELDSIICSGPLRLRSGQARGGQFTYALTAELTPKTKELTTDEALRELTNRYFMSHGPATVRDFVWWSGLLTADVRRGIELAKLKSENVEGKQYWFAKSSLTTNYILPATMYLLPNYDEYTIAYQDRDAYINPHTVIYFKNQGNAAFWNAIVYKGEIIGMWRKTLVKNSMNVQVRFFEKLNTDERRALEEATDSYSKFLGIPVETK